MKKHLLWIVLFLQASLSSAADHFNILVYHHVSDSTPFSTSISPTKFREHLQFFKDNQMSILSLEQALALLNSHNALPERSIVITFDDGYKNIYEQAWPLLKEYDYPFTIFISTDSIDQRYANMLTWDQLREMKTQGVTIANHSSDHGHLATLMPTQEYLEEVRVNIAHAQSRIQEELNIEPLKWFAYPYGEFNQGLQQLLSDMDFIGFAQHSGGVWAGTNRQAVPRFAAAGHYANLTTLKTKLESKPMRVNESLLPDMTTVDTQPEVNITLLTKEDMSEVVNCFVDGQAEQATWISDLSIQVTSHQTLDTGRHRFNCTSRSLSDNFYYWFSKPWLILRDHSKESNQ